MDGETVIIGKRTREIIKGHCRELAAAGITGAGSTRACAPYEIIRPVLRGGHVIATHAGEGLFFIDGEWQPALPGSVFLAPPGVAESFKPAKGKSWSFCWLHVKPEFFVNFAPNHACLMDADVTLFCHAVEGFIHSAYSDDYAATASPWADLIRYYAQRFIRSSSSGLRLEKVWSAVANEPGHPWSTDELSRQAGMSREQLRIHAKKETGRSPMQQVTHIRMQRAIQVLQTCDYKLEVIAELVGYENAFAFSKALLKATGKRPSFYRLPG